MLSTLISYAYYLKGMAGFQELDIALLTGFVTGVVSSGTCDAIKNAVQSKLTINNSNSIPH